jgi:hypothetical protein
MLIVRAAEIQFRRLFRLTGRNPAHDPKHGVLSSHPAGEDIIANGFRDGTGTYLTGDIYGGVWLSDVPLTADYGISALGNDGDVILRVTLPCTLEDLAGYEWIEELTDPDTGEVWTRRDREWLVLAEMIGAKMRKSVMPAFMSS